MFFFKKKPTILSSGYFDGFTDYHCHILPGVDDGVRRMEDTLEILAEYEKLGVQTVWCTPHIMEDIPNTTQRLQERFCQLQEAYKGPIQLNLAAEYMIDGLFDQRLSEGDLLPLGPSKDQVLVETSYFNPPLRFEQTLGEIKSKGFYPVLAHPERYMYMSDKDYYKKLRMNGIRFQMNLASLAGVYGNTAKKKAEMLLQEGFYDYTGTDLHNIDLLDAIYEVKRPIGLK